MTYEKALGIANEFLKDMNPSLWDGEGDKPADFDERIWEDIESLRGAGHYSLELTFAYDGGYWNTYVDIVDGNSEEVVQQSSCYGINSVNDVATIIEEVCRWSSLKGI